MAYIGQVGVHRATKKESTCDWCKETIHIGEHYALINYKIKKGEEGIYIHSAYHKDCVKDHMFDEARIRKNKKKPGRKSLISLGFTPEQAKERHRLLVYLNRDRLNLTDAITYGKPRSIRTQTNNWRKHYARLLEMGNCKPTLGRKDNPIRKSLANFIPEYNDPQSVVSKAMKDDILNVPFMLCDLIEAKLDKEAESNGHE